MEKQGMETKQDVEINQYKEAQHHTQYIVKPSLQ